MFPSLSVVVLLNSMVVRSLTSKSERKGIIDSGIFCRLDGQSPDIVVDFISVLRSSFLLESKDSLLLRLLTFSERTKYFVSVFPLWCGELYSE